MSNNIFSIFEKSSKISTISTGILNEGLRPGELCKKDVIDFYQYNTIIKNINEDILKLEAKMSEEKEKNNIVVKISI